MSLARNMRMAAAGAGGGGAPFAYDAYDDYVLGTTWGNGVTLKAYYPLTEEAGTGTAYDAVNDTTDNAEVPGATQGISGPWAGAAGVDTTTGNIHLADLDDLPNGTQDFTICLWQAYSGNATWGWNITAGNPDSSATTGYVQKCTGSDDYRYDVGTSAAQSQQSSSRNATMPNETWVMHVVVFNFTDGQVAVSDNGGSKAVIDNISVGGGFTFNDHVVKVTNHLKASKVAVFSGRLLNSDIAALYAERL